MASAFSFGFAGDDIDIDDSELNTVDEGYTSVTQDSSSTLPELVAAQRHELSDLLSSLPSQVSFNKLNINTTQDDQTSVKTLTLARREVFDIRTQLMAEDTADYANEELISGLEKGDITPNIYEGGFKTWECSVDLAKLVANENILSNADAGDRHIIEVGFTFFGHLILAPSIKQLTDETSLAWSRNGSAVACSVCAIAVQP